MDGEALDSSLKERAAIFDVGSPQNELSRQMSSFFYSLLGSGEIVVNKSRPIPL